MLPGWRMFKVRSCLTLICCKSKKIKLLLLFPRKVLDHPSVDKLIINSIDQMIFLLQKGRSEIGIINLSEFKSTYSGTDVMNQISPIFPPVETTNAFLAFSVSEFIAK